MNPGGGTSCQLQPALALLLPLLHPSLLTLTDPGAAAAPVPASLWGGHKDLVVPITRPGIEGEAYRFNSLATELHLPPTHISSSHPPLVHAQQTEEDGRTGGRDKARCGVFDKTPRGDLRFVTKFALPLGLAFYLSQWCCSWWRMRMQQSIKLEPRSTPPPTPPSLCLAPLSKRYSLVGVFQFPFNRSGICCSPPD